MGILYLFAYRQTDDATVIKVNEKDIKLKRMKIVFKPWALVFKLEIYRIHDDGSKMFLRTFTFQQCEFTVFLEFTSKSVNIYGEFKSLEMHRLTLNEQVRRVLLKTPSENFPTVEKNLMNWIWDQMHKPF